MHCLNPSCPCPAQRKAAIGLKEEYHAFRDRSGVILFSFAAVLLVGLSRADARRKAGEPFSLTPPLMVGAQCFLTWLLYFYTAMALRENVLKARSTRFHPLPLCFGYERRSASPGARACSRRVQLAFFFLCPSVLATYAGHPHLAHAVTQTGTARRRCAEGGAKHSMQVNGSNIRPWWIHHHYWAMVTTTLVLALPVDSAAVQAFVRKFLWWSCFQARLACPAVHLLCRHASVPARPVHGMMMSIRWLVCHGYAAVLAVYCRARRSKQLDMCWHVHMFGRPQAHCTGSLYRDARCITAAS